MYYAYVTGEIEKEIENAQLWEETYPRDWYPHNGLAFTYRQIGRFEDAIREAQEAVHLETNYVMPYSNLAYAYRDLNRFDEAKAMISQEISRGMDTEYLHWILYQIAFVQGDATGMTKQAELVRGRPEESTMLVFECAAAGATGQVRRSRELCQRAVDLAQSHNLKEEAADYLAGEATLEATLGNEAQARTEVKHALAISPRSVEGGAAFTLARIGEFAQASDSAQTLTRRFPSGTFVQ